MLNVGNLQFTEADTYTSCNEFFVMLAVGSKQWCCEISKASAPYLVQRKKIHNLRRVLLEEEDLCGCHHYSPSLPTPVVFGAHASRSQVRAQVVPVPLSTRDTERGEGEAALQQARCHSPMARASLR